MLYLTKNISDVSSPGYVKLLFFPIAKDHNIEAGNIFTTETLNQMSESPETSPKGNSVL